MSLNIGPVRIRFFPPEEESIEENASIQPEIHSDNAIEEVAVNQEKKEKEIVPSDLYAQQLQYELQASHSRDEVMDESLTTREESPIEEKKSLSKKERKEQKKAEKKAHKLEKREHKKAKHHI